MFQPTEDECDILLNGLQYVIVSLEERLSVTDSADRMFSLLRRERRIVSNLVSKILDEKNRQVADRYSNGS